MPRTNSFDHPQVARLYFEALDLGLPIISTIVDILDVSAARAKQMVRQVRAAGLLGTAPHFAARATIHRGSAGKERNWLVCEHCIHPWPCKAALPTLMGRKHEQPARKARRSRPVG
jgi:hypothetical protein